MADLDSCVVCGATLRKDNGKCNFELAIERQPFRADDVMNQGRLASWETGIMPEYAVRLWKHVRATYHVSVYRPIAGWKAVLYSCLGPEQTSYFGYKTPQEAYKDAKELAEEYNCRLEELTFEKCELHPKDWRHWKVNGSCDGCHSDEVIAKIKELSR